MALWDEVAAVRAGRGRSAAMIGEFRRTAVLVPLDDRGGLWTAGHEGVWWIHAFTDERALARFAGARAGRRDWEYRTVLGARLLDVVVPGLGEPAGVALDMGGERPMLFPPAPGIVPDGVAVAP
ncbi:SseB family protein [Streptomyces eurocidicus]|uniref:SseB protein N-terminal domain-containing protein n=2 Tax=Streptomyces eurocidicus TaxID=66423 RepID=A0A7W8F2K5_STREU|nr:SseB family protein [Streptomyces eurocidicus]MBB5119642.1 hypothetical protein [Streptomyces eurocidicus]MBF6050671.1 SseB family protein [Streptomyces eurocidicus]